MENVHCEITAQDIEGAKTLKEMPTPSNRDWTLVGPTPVSVALERTLGSKWKTLGAIVVMEDRAPFRFGSVPSEGIAALEQFLKTGQMQPCSFSMELHVLKWRPEDEPQTAVTV